MKMINKNTEKDKKDTIYNVSKIIKYCSIKDIKCLHLVIFFKRFPSIKPV